jgi:hypothetical protein
MNIRIAPHPHYLAEMDLDYPQSEAAERIVFEVSRARQHGSDNAEGNTVSDNGNTPTRGIESVVRLEYLLCGFMAGQGRRPMYRFDRVLD